MDAAQELFTQLLTERIVESVGARRAGHCIRIVDAPLSVASACCISLAQRFTPPDLAVVVRKHPGAAHERTPTQVVELRNRSDQTGHAGVLVVFIPPRERLSVEDSIGPTTFETIGLTDLGERSWDLLLDRLWSENVELAGAVQRVTDVVSGDRNRFEASHADLASFGIRAAETLRDDRGITAEAAVGRALPALGLLPDRDLLSFDDDEIRRRLQLNRQQMETLTQPIDPAERIRQLPIDAVKSSALAGALLTSVRDGGVDRASIAAALDDRASLVDLSQWGDLGQGVMYPELFTVVKVIGDVDRTNGEAEVTKDRASIGVEFEIRPPASSYPDASLLLEVLRLGNGGREPEEIGVSVRKSRQLPMKTRGTLRKKMSCGEPDSDLPGPDVYQFRLSLVAHDGTTLGSDLSEHFRVGDVETTPPKTDLIEHPFQAAVMVALKEGHLPTRTEVTAIVEDAEGLLDQIEVRIDNYPGRFVVEIPSRLADLDATLLEEPRTLSGFRLDLSATDSEYEIVAFGESVPQEFIEARADLFERLCIPDPSILGEAVAQARPHLALADLQRHQGAIDSYVRTWIEALSTADAAARHELLATDRLLVTENARPVFIALSPLHPVRLAWQVKYAEVGKDWLTGCGSFSEEELKSEAAELADALPGLLADELPLVVSEHGYGLRYRNPLYAGWGLWACDGTSRRDQLERRLYSWLEVEPRGLRRNGESEVLSRIRAYLTSHPYVRTLVFNVVRPGRADFVLRLIGRLSDNEHLRYTVRLFGEENDPLLGQALDDFMVDPDGGEVSRNAAEVLTRVRSDSLRPTVAFSKHSLEDLRRHPESFPAHITVFLDYFELEVLAAPSIHKGRSLFGGGLLAGASSTFDAGSVEPAIPPHWVSIVQPVPQDGQLIGQALHAHAQATARDLGAADDESLPVVRLTLDVLTESLLNAVHESSDWVVIVDPVFSDQYLGDLSRQLGDGQVTRYVVDSRDTRASGELRNVVVSSRLRQEQAALLAAAADEFSMHLEETGKQVLLQGLHLLGAGLGLRMLADGTRRTEALSLSLAAAFLAEQGFLRHALIVPLDEYPELFVESQGLGEISSLSRTDLLVVRFDPQHRRIDSTLIEVKVRSQLGESGGVPTKLLDDITAQLENTKPVVISRLFGAHLRDRPNSLPAALRTRRLTGILRRHLERSLRHSYIKPEEAAGIAAFIDTVDQGLIFSLDTRGLVFSLNGPSLKTQRYGGVDVDVVGREQVVQLLQSPNPQPTIVGPDGAYLRTILGAPAQMFEAIPIAQPPTEGTLEEEAERTMAQDEPPPEPSGSAIKLSSVDLIGHASNTPQFAVIGNHHSTGAPVALDMGGTNVITVFGVQGSGKSYTVGSLVEGGLIRMPALGPLPKPLATVVFHYSADATYRSEFATLARPTHDPVAVEWLRERGAAPAAVDEVVVLVSERQLDRRRTEYSGLRVEPLGLSASELTLADWKLLMGIEGGKQMYAKELALVLRDMEGDFTADQLRERIEQTELPKQQKSIAKARVRFVEEYLRTDGHVRDWLKPGRLLIVDVRDELIDKDEALSIFMVLLNRFAEVNAEGSERFNKMVVFDEAHKYMTETSLTDAIKEAVREMRHKGVTMVIASQDPLSVPAVVVELSTVIITHRITSPAWLRSLKNSSQAFESAGKGELAGLRAGQALVWSAGGSSRYRQPQRVDTRPRLTEHGGGTVRVDG